MAFLSKVGQIPEIILDGISKRIRCHWAYFVEGRQWQENGDGSFSVAFR